MFKVIFWALLIVAPLCLVCSLIAKLKKDNLNAIYFSLLYLVDLTVIALLYFGSMVM